MEAREATIEDLRSLPARFLASYAQGLPDWAIDWLFHSNTKEAIENRRFIKAKYAEQADSAAIRQKQHFEHMKRTKHLLDPKAPIRRLGIIDEWYVNDFKAKHGSGCLNNKEFLDDTKKKSPQLFFPK